MVYVRPVVSPYTLGKLKKKDIPLSLSVARNRYHVPPPGVLDVGAVIGDGRPRRGRGEDAAHAEAVFHDV